MMTAEHIPEPLLEHALAYAARGLEVFPLKPGKQPYTKSGMLDATTNAQQIVAWWTRWPNALIGCRVPEGRIILDIDPRKNGQATWDALQEHYGPFELGRVHASGRGDGGAHYWFVLPNDIELSIKGLDEWAHENGCGQAILKSDGTPSHKWTCGIDLLTHTHRYSILPPSPHEATGKPYTWTSTISATPLPDVLRHLLTKPEPEPPIGDRPHLTVVNDDSPADWYSRNADYNDILPPHGWTLVSGDGNSDGSKWKHPTASSDWSATIRHGLLFVHSTSTVFDETSEGDPHGYTRFRAYALLEHDGDLSAAARTVNTMRDDTPERINPADLLPTQSEWAEPQPLQATTTPPTFPIDALPEVARDHVQVIADDLQTSIDLPAVLYLAALSTIIAPKRKLNVQGSWQENLNLYLVVALPPGAGKSPAVRQILHPLFTREQQQREAAAPAVAKTKQARRMIERRMSAAEKRGDTAEAQRALADLIETPEKEPPRLIANNATPEALEQLLAQNDGTIALINTEGGPFDQMTGQYSDRANLDVYLQAWSGDHIAVDRIGRDHLTIRDPRLTVALTVQPAVLEKLRDRPELAGRGLTARFMYSLPANNVGWRDLKKQTEPGNRTDDAYIEHLEQIMAIHDKYGNFRPLHLDPDALTMFLDYRQSLETRRRDGNDLCHLAEWSIKLESSVARTAGLLCVANGEEQVTRQIMNDAILVGDYWIGHAKEVAALWGTDPVTALAIRILAWATKRRGQPFSHRDAYVAHRAVAPRSGDIDGPLELLVSTGWIRPIPVDKSLSRGGRPPSPRYEVYPK